MSTWTAAELSSSSGNDFQVEYRLLNAANGNTVLKELNDGDIIDISNWGIRFNVLATVVNVVNDIDDVNNGDEIGSIIFNFDGMSKYMIHNGPSPNYILTGDDNDSTNGNSSKNYIPRLALNGKHAISITAYEKKNGKGKKMTSDIMSVSFTIIKSSLDPCTLDAISTTNPTITTASASAASSDVLPYKANRTGYINIDTNDIHIIRLWHKVTIGFIGPNTCERSSTINPFTDYRMDVLFQHEYRTDILHTIKVPGYYATDGNSANTGSTSGNVWLVHFTPTLTGKWIWKTNFRYGNNIIFHNDENDDDHDNHNENHNNNNEVGISAGYFDQMNGTFQVYNTNKKDSSHNITTTTHHRDHRGHGILDYIPGKHHYQYRGSKKYYLKVGSDSPENLLSYHDFDSTPNMGQYRKTWKSHIQDFHNNNNNNNNNSTTNNNNNNDPTWAGGKGKGIIGAINYLSKQGMNAFSFLTMNINGDDGNVYPFISRASSIYAGNDRLRIDVSKLSQWEIIFSHADKMGMFMHIKMQEQENDQLFENDDGTTTTSTTFGNERKLYYRELIARFSHHLALNWNIGEENTNTVLQRKEFAKYIKNIDPYKHPIVIHTYPWDKRSVSSSLLGQSSSYDGFSLQCEKEDIFNSTLELVTKSAQAGKTWIITNDEQNSASDGVLPDDVHPNNHDSVRKLALWGNIMAGGGGVEYYFGYAYHNSDLTCEDFRSRANMWKQSRYALDFFHHFNIPFWNMSNHNEILGTNNNNWCLASVNDDNTTYEVLVVYIRNGGNENINIPFVNGNKMYSVHWYDPRNGGPLQYGSRTSIPSGKVTWLGYNPDIDSNSNSNHDDDWVVLLKRIVENTITTNTPTWFPTKSPQITMTPSTLFPTRSPTIKPNTWSPTRSPITSTQLHNLIIESLSLVDTNTNTIIQDGIVNNSIFDVLYTGTSLTIIANMIQHSTEESVVFDLDDTKQYIVESRPPYSLGGTSASGMNLPVDDLTSPIPSKHVVSATAYSKDGGMGMKGPKLTLAFTMTTYNFAVIGFMLVDASNNKDIILINDGDEINLNQVGTTSMQLNIRILTTTTVDGDDATKNKIGSVRCRLDSLPWWTENVAPYAIGGDDNGNYIPVPELTIPGIHRVKAIPYSERDEKGIQGVSVDTTFVIVVS